MQTFKLIGSVALSLISGQRLAACDVCVAQQPRILQEFTHGLGPSGPGDYILPSLMVGIMLFAFFRAIQCLGKAADRPHQRIKRLILSNNDVLTEND